MTALLTPARRRALEVLAAAHPRPGRYSNETKRGGDTNVALLHWQAADWLVDQGLVVAAGMPGAPQLTLTTAGIIAAKAAGIEVRNA